jgi:UDP-glucose 4-epimerase
MSILVVGGAGFIGSVLIKRFLEEGKKVVVIDKLSLGSIDNINLSKVNFYQIDVNEIDKVVNMMENDNANIDEVWHLAANSDIPAGVKDVDVDLHDTFLSTISILKIMKKIGCKKLYFSSSSAIYGDHQERLYEDIGPLLPISNYGAMKLASEAAITAALESFLDEVAIFRFPNVVGIPATHGVILDFVRRLKNDPSQLSVLGNGTQQKTYLHVAELVDAMLYIVKNSKEKLSYYNIGAMDDGVLVKNIAEEVVRRVAPKATIHYQNSDRGWVGDIPKFLYSVDKLSSLGWTPSNSSFQAIVKAVDQIAIQEGLQGVPN